MRHMRASLSDAIKKAEVVVICCNDKKSRSFS
jgi:hypothetical protein